MPANSSTDLSTGVPSAAFSRYFMSQIWVEIGPRPIPRKYVITSKTVTGAPQYTVRIKDLKTDALADDAFAFKPPAGAKKVELSALDDVDEIPRGVPKGAKK